MLCGSYLLHFAPSGNNVLKLWDYWHAEALGTIGCLDGICFVYDCACDDSCRKINCLNMQNE